VGGGVGGVVGVGNDASRATHLQEIGLGTSGVSQKRVALQENGTWDLWRQAHSAAGRHDFPRPDAKPQVTEIGRSSPWPGGPSAT